MIARFDKDGDKALNEQNLPPHSRKWRTVVTIFREVRGKVLRGQKAKVMAADRVKAKEAGKVKGKVRERFERRLMIT